MPDRFRLLADVTPLRESTAFRRLWVGTTLSSVGSAVTSFAVILQVYDLTRSTLAVGAVAVAQMVPTLAVGLLGGPVTDATDRRKLVLATSGGLAAVSAALTAQAFAGLRLVWLLYALVAIQSSLIAIDRPARSTFIPSLLPSSQLTAGLALSRLSSQIMLTAGPALAGLIAGSSHLGLRACYLLDAVSFAAALYGVARLPVMRPQASALRPGPRAIAEGIGFIGRSQVLAGAFLADLNATVFGLPIALFPAINAERFGGTPARWACSPRPSAWAGWWPAARPGSGRRLRGGRGRRATRQPGGRGAGIADITGDKRSGRRPGHHRRCHRDRTDAAGVQPVPPPARSSPGGRPACRRPGPGLRLPGPAASGRPAQAAPGLAAAAITGTAAAAVAGTMCCRPGP